MKKQDPSSVYIITPCSLQRSREYPASEQFVFDANVNINQVQKIIKSLATNKSAGIDCLPAILPSITSIINATFLSAQFPNVWKIAEVTPSLKAGDSLRVAVPTPRGKTGGRERRSLPPVFPRGVGTATRRLGWRP